MFIKDNDDKAYRHSQTSRKNGALALLFTRSPKVNREPGQGHASVPRDPLGLSVSDTHLQEQQ